MSFMNESKIRDYQKKLKGRIGILYITMTLIIGYVVPLSSFITVSGHPDPDILQ